MRKVLILLCVLMISFAGLGQEAPQVPGADLITQKLDKVNKALSKKLDKINRKLTKKLLKVYPQLKGVNIDSLMEERAYKAEQLTEVDTTGLLAEDKVAALQQKGQSALMNDSTWQEIQALKAQLSEDMGLTPGALDIHQEMGETLSKLGKTEELLKQFQTPDLPEFPNLSLPALPAVPDLKDLLSTKYLDDLKTKVSGLGKLMSEYKDQFKGWDKKLLARATSLEQVKLLQEQKKLMDAYTPLPEGYRENMQGFQTNDFVKEKLQLKAAEIAKVGGKSLQERLNEGQAKLDKAKQKFNRVEGLEGGMKERNNPHKGKPLLKRLVLGGNFQVNRQKPTSLDAAVQLSYLINARARFGVGGSYRFNFGKNSLRPDFDTQVFSTRSFFDYTLFRSAFIEASYEWSNTDVINQDNVALGRQWVQSAMIGIGNRFNLPKGLKGNFVALYNLLHDEKSPNPNPWVFRVGFEF